MQALPFSNGTASDYEDLEQLGSGAYGTVYSALDPRTGRVVAKKKVLVPIQEDGIPQALIREISTLKLLHAWNHPNIAQLLDVVHGISDNNRNLWVHMIFEKCDWDLYVYLHNLRSDLHPSQSQNFAHQIFSGIDFLHSNNVLHRDLKPQNILVNRNGTVKITDFGLARTYSHLAAFTTTVVTLWFTLFR